MRNRAYLLATALSGLLCALGCTSSTSNMDGLQVSTAQDHRHDAYIWLDRGSPISGPNMSGVTVEKLHPTWKDRLNRRARHDVCATTNNSGTFSIAWISDSS